MKNHGKVYSSIAPNLIEITENAVYIASNIQAYTKTIEGHVQSGYEYDCVEYGKDEYLSYQASQIAALQQELEAAKILLGVD